MAENTQADKDRDPDPGKLNADKGNQQKPGSKISEQKQQADDDLDLGFQSADGDDIVPDMDKKAG
jgi:hypothetical protein